VLITARRPIDVAREVETHKAKGCTSFVVREVDHGGMLDRERLGAARYAAGFYADVALEPAAELAASR
jgi:hypothetical protein